MSSSLVTPLLRNFGGHVAGATILGLAFNVVYWNGSDKPRRQEIWDHFNKYGNNPEARENAFGSQE